MLSGTKTELTPLQKRLADLGKILGTVSVFLCILLFVMAVLQRRNVAEMLITAISLAVAGSPGRTAGDRYDGTGTFGITHGKGQYDCEKTAECGNFRLCECGMFG